MTTESLPGNFEKMSETEFFARYNTLPSKCWRAKLVEGGSELKLAAPDSEEYVHSVLSAVAVDAGFKSKHQFKSFPGDEAKAVLNLEGSSGQDIEIVAEELIPERPYARTVEVQNRRPELLNMLLQPFGLSLEK